jgi:hypothetical protein
LDKNSYHSIHNVTLPTGDGTTQIDHIIVSPYGIFVVETKNYSGWIFGDEKQAIWTQKIYRKTYRFQNPLRQNFKHVKALEALLRLPPEAFHSVIVFLGGSTFKTPMPDNVTYIDSYIRYIKSKQQIILSDSQVESIVQSIHSERLAPTFATSREHIRNLEAKHPPSDSPICPRCGSSMLLKTAKTGAKAGGNFWGCSRFPKCRATQAID